MDRAEVRRLLDAERRGLAYDDTVAEPRARVTRISARDGSHRSVVWSQLTPADADEVIAEEIAHHRQLGLPFEWKLYAHDRPPDLRRRLVRHGFAIGACEAVVVYDLTRPAAWLDTPGVRVVPVDGPAQVAAYRQVAERVFDKDYAFTADELSAALAAGSTQHRGYIAYADDEPASIGRLYTHPDSAFGALYGGGTLPARRGQGLYRALVSARARDARAAGARFLLVDALPTSRPILERLGFVHLTDTWPCEWCPGGASSPSPGA